MNNLDKYDSTSERLDNATVEERFFKFLKISNGLKDNGIDIIGLGNACINLEDKSCNYKLSHEISSWEIFKVVDVVDMIVTGRNNFIEQNGEK